MRKWFRHILILVSLVFPVLVIAQDGPESGGGGGVILTASGPRLVDFYNVIGGEARLQTVYLQKNPSRLRLPERFSFDRQDQVNDPAYREVLRIFGAWSDIPFDTIGTLINLAIYRPLVWDFVPDPITAPPSYRPSSLPADALVQTAAYYLKQDHHFHIRVNLGTWNRLPLPDQTGLLIHETLRHVQIGLSQNFDDEALQKATAMMMICKPGVRLNQYLFFLLNNRRDLAEARFEPYDVLTKECWR